MGERTTPASDLYSLGVVAFELLTGRRPFEGDSVAAEAAAHVTGELPSVCELNESVPCEVDPVLAKALAKHPAERYGSCAEFVAALRGALAEAAGPTRVLGAVALPPPPPRRGRPAWLVPVLAALLLAGAGAAVAVALFGDNSPKRALPPQKVSISVKTVTQPGTTIVTTAAATTAATTAPTSEIGRAHV